MMIFNCPRGLPGHGRGRRLGRLLFCDSVRVPAWEQAAEEPALSHQALLQSVSGPRVSLKLVACKLFL